MKTRLSRVFLLALMMLFALAGYAQADFVRTDSGTKYQAENGTFLTGLQQINGEYYYFNEAGILRQKKGWFTAQDGKEYYSTKNGVLYHDRWIRKKYYVKENCEKAKGLTTIGNTLFYFSQETGKIQKGKLKDAQGNLYIADSKGVIYAGTLFRYKKKGYYAHEDGKLALGLTKVGNDYYCFRKKNGTMYSNIKKKCNGATYYFTASGKAARNTWVKIKSKYYYFQDDCRMATSKYIGDRWYVNENGERVSSAEAPKAGVNKVDGKIYLYDESGQLVVSKWVKLDGSTYYAGTDGTALCGLQTIGSDKYYFNDEGVLQTDTIVLVNGTAYVVGEDGRITGTSDASGSSMAVYAQKFVGNPYVWGGTDPVKGADCSGFCYAIHQKFGIQLMRVADDQMKGPSSAYIKLGYKKGTVIRDEDLLPGDLVFYGSSSYASHVAMYIGNHKIVHAANSRLGIIISDMDYVKSRVKDRNMRYWA